ncbi:MAG: DUF2752 domain-containing protein [Pedosphaera sp.]|nr:DUF2752 domain-containing protein [Pedosphaera sp.]
MNQGCFSVLQRYPLPFVGFVASTCLWGLYHFNPQEHGFYPRCLFYQTTGLWCPGCGGLRSCHQLLHGNISAAFRLNPLAVILLPGMLMGLAEWWLMPTGRRRLLTLAGDPNFIVGVGGALCGFGVARNLPLLEWITRVCS